MQFWPPDDEHIVLETCRGMKQTYWKTKILCIKLVNYWDKYTEMHGQQNVKTRNVVAPKMNNIKLANAQQAQVTYVVFSHLNVLLNCNKY